MDGEGPSPRLCHIVKMADFDGYGFNLHAEKHKMGQYIGKVDPSSPADLGGLKEGDKIVEVNGVNINQENHKQVVQRIKTVPNETKLLVVDRDTEEYYKERGIVIKGSLPFVKYICSDGRKRIEEEEEEEDDEEKIDTRIQTPVPPVRVESPDIVEEEEEDEEDEEVEAARRGVSVLSHHDSVKREDSLMSERTLSNRSSVSSGKDAVEEGDQAVSQAAAPKAEPSAPPAPSETEQLQVTLDHPDIDYIDADKVEDEEAAVANSGDKSDDDDDDNGSETDKPDVNTGTPAAAHNSRGGGSLADSEAVTDSKPAVEAEADRQPPVDLLPAVAENGPKAPNSLSSGSPRSTPSPTNNKDSGLDLPLTAREMRERIGSRKKKDPRKDDRMDFRKKFEIIQTL